MGAFYNAPFISVESLDLDRLTKLFGNSVETKIKELVLLNNIVPFHELMQNTGIFDIVTESDILSLFTKKNFSQSLLYTKDLLEITTGNTKILDIIDISNIKSIKELKEMLDLSFYFTLGYSFDDRFDRDIVYDDEISYKINRNNAFYTTTAQYMICNIMKWDKFYKLADKLDKEYGRKILFTYLVSKLNSVLLNLCGLNYQMVTNDIISNTIFNNHIRDIYYTTDKNSFDWLISSGLNMLNIKHTPNEALVEFPHVFNSEFNIKKYPNTRLFNNLDPELFTILVKSANRVLYIRELILSMIAGIANIIDTPYGMVVQYSYNNISDRNISPLVFEIFSFVIGPDPGLIETPNISENNEPILKN